jgi:hypothetical protein
MALPCVPLFIAVGVQRGSGAHWCACEAFPQCSWRATQTVSRHSILSGPTRSGVQPLASSSAGNATAMHRSEINARSSSKRAAIAATNARAKSLACRRTSATRPASVCIAYGSVVLRLLLIYRFRLDGRRELLLAINPQCVPRRSQTLTNCGRTFPSSRAMPIP